MLNYNTKSRARKPEHRYCYHAAPRRPATRQTIFSSAKISPLNVRARLPSTEPPVPTIIPNLNILNYIFFAYGKHYRGSSEWTVYPVVAELPYIERFHILLFKSLHIVLFLVSLSFPPKLNKKR